MSLRRNIFVHSASFKSTNLDTLQMQYLLMANIKDIHSKVTEMLDSFSKLHEFRMNKVL